MQILYHNFVARGKNPRPKQFFTAFYSFLASFIKLFPVSVQVRRCKRQLPGWCWRVVKRKQPDKPTGGTTMEEIIVPFSISLKSHWEAGKWPGEILRQL